MPAEEKCDWHPTVQSSGNIISWKKQKTLLCLNDYVFSCYIDYIHVYPTSYTSKLEEEMDTLVI